jgi:hypothetical protein
MIRTTMTLAVLLVTLGFVLAQNPSTQSPPTASVNAGTVNGVAPGYRPQATSGLSIALGPGTAWCGGSLQQYGGGSVVVSASTTNYVFLDTTNLCTATANTTGFPRGSIPIAIVSTSATAIASVQDVRTWFAVPGSGRASSETSIDWYPGANVTDRLNNCLSYASVSTLVCNARSLTGSLSGTSFTIPDNTALLLGNVTLLLSPGSGNFAVTMGNNSRLEGMAPGFGSVVSPTRLRIQNSAGHGIHFKCTNTNPCTSGSTTQAPIIRNLELQNQNSTNTGIGIDWSGVQHGEFSNVWVHQWGIASLCNSTSFTASENGFYNFFSNDLTGTEVGLVVQGTCNSNNWFNPHIIVSSATGSKAIQWGSTSGTQPNENSMFGATLESGVAGQSTALNIDGGSELRMYGGRFEGFANALATNAANCANILRVVLNNPRFVNNTTNVSNSCTQVEVRGVRSRGTATLSSGAATVTFTPSYQVAPTCQCVDTTAAAAVKCTPTAGSLAIAGTGTDVISYVCEGNPN